MTTSTAVLAFGVLPANGGGQVALPTSDGYRIVTQEDYQRVLGALAFWGIGSHCNLSPAGMVGYEFARQEFSAEMRLFERVLGDPTYTAWLAEGAPKCGCAWDGEYSDVDEDFMRDGFIGD